MKFRFSSRQQHNLDAALLPFIERWPVDLRRASIAPSVLHLQRPRAAQLNPRLKFLVHEIFVKRLGVADLGVATGLFFRGRHGNSDKRKPSDRNPRVARPGRATWSRPFAAGGLSQHAVDGDGRAGQRLADRAIVLCPVNQLGKLLRGGSGDDASDDYVDTEDAFASHYAFAKTTTLFAGMTMLAEVGWLCSEGPSAVMPPSLPATCGLTSTPLALQLS